MGYGLEFYGDNGQLIFDTDNFPSAQTLTIEDGHPTTLGNNSTVSVPSDALMFARVSSGNLYGVKNFSNNAYTNKSGQSISYFFARETNEADNISGSGTYGLEIYGTNGTTVNFSTRRVANSTLNFKRVHDHNALANSGSVYSGTNSTVYVSVDYQFYSSTSQITSIVNGFYWTSSNIRYDGYIQTQEGSTTEEAEVTSKGTIAVVELRTS
jgi:hypothetical protein